MLDTLFSNVSDVISSGIPVPWRLVTFGLFAIAALPSGVYLASSQSKKITNELGLRSPDLIVMSKIIRAIQYVISGLLVAIIAQSALTSQYSTLLMIAVIGLGYLGGSVMTGLLSYKFLQWYRSNRDNTILLYLLSSSILSVLLVTTIIAQSMLIFSSYPDEVEWNSVPTFPTQQAGSSDDLVVNILMMFYLVTFFWLVLTWIASATMLNRYSKRMKPRTRWLLILSPMVTMTIVTIPWFLTLQSSPFDEQLMVYRMIGISAILAQGFLAAFAFLVISRNMRKSRIQNRIVQYIEIAAVGITVLFMSIPANIAAGAFPPFGTISYSFLALGSYLFLAGIYSSAISASADIKLRKMIRKSLNQSGLIDNIGLANLNQELQKQIAALIRTQEDALRKETDIPISETDAKNYLDEVFHEIKSEQLKRSRSGRTSSNKQKTDSSAAAAP